MALFNNKDVDKTASAQAAARPQAPVVTPPVAEEKPIPSRPVVTPVTPEGRAYLDRGSRISGKLFFETAARIDGQVDGEINAKDGLTIGETAMVTAQIIASSVIVSGKVSGDITATQRIEIRPSAKVVGNLASPILIIHEGAHFEGHCAMQPEGARDDRKVTVFPKEERLAQAGGHKLA
jgi:cytoskeletal protein CcmA (bactofilin family)